MFISDPDAEVSLCSSACWALLPGSQWEGLGDFGGDNLENSSQKCCHHQYGEWHSGLHYEEWSNPVKGGYYSHHPTWCSWSCTWNRESNFWFPHQKNAGKLERVSLEDYQMFWSLWGEAGETAFFFFLSSREAKRQFHSSLQLPERQFRGGRAEVFLVMRDGKRRSKRQVGLDVSKNSPKRVVWHWHR